MVTPSGESVMLVSPQRSSSRSLPGSGYISIRNGPLAQLQPVGSVPAGIAGAEIDAPEVIGFGEMLGR